MTGDSGTGAKRKSISVVASIIPLALLVFGVWALCIAGEELGVMLWGTRGTVTVTECEPTTDEGGTPDGGATCVGTFVSDAGDLRIEDVKITHDVDRDVPVPATVFRPFATTAYTYVSVWEVVFFFILALFLLGAGVLLGLVAGWPIRLRRSGRRSSRY